LPRYVGGNTLKLLTRNDEKTFTAIDDYNCRSSVYSINVLNGKGRKK